MQKSYDPLGITVPTRSAKISNPNAQIADAHKEGKPNQMHMQNNSKKAPSVGKLGLRGNGRDL